jgi:hypothetical protein
VRAGVFFQSVVLLHEWGSCVPSLWGGIVERSDVLSFLQAAKAASKNMKTAPFLTGSERWAVKYTIVKKGQDAEGMGDEKVEEPVDLDLSKTGAFADVLSKKVPSAAFRSGIRTFSQSRLAPKPLLLRIVYH